MRRTIPAKNDIHRTTTTSSRRATATTLSAGAAILASALMSAVPLGVAHADFVCKIEDGNDPRTIGDPGQAFACGQSARVDGSNSTAIGGSAKVETNPRSTSTGETVQSGTAIGARSHVYDDEGTALGRGATAGNNNFDSDDAEYATAIGSRSSATAAHSTALGAETSATVAGSVAIGRDSSGQGATAGMENQFMLGTSNHTYTAPGITSTTSKNRQSGPLEVLTSDANGNLATDGGALFEDVERNREDIKETAEGVALAMAVENPDLKGAETFGLMVNWGSFEGKNALGLTGMGVLHEDIDDGRISIGGGVGWGLSDDTFGARVGLQWTR